MKTNERKSLASNLQGRKRELINNNSKCILSTDYQAQYFISIISFNIVNSS